MSAKQKEISRVAVAYTIAFGSWALLFAAFAVQTTN